jgi:hypothetical protein
MIISATIASFLNLAALPPQKAAIWAVKHELGRKSLKPRDWGLVNQLLQISWRESRQKRISVHTRDLAIAPRMYDQAVHVGWLSPQTCEHHRAETRAEKRRFVVRGSWGLSGAYNLKYLTSCHPPEILDIPAVSALVAVRKIRANRGDVRAAWSGKLKCQERRKSHGSCKNLKPREAA